MLMNDAQRLRIYGQGKQDIYRKELEKLSAEAISQRNKELIKLFLNSLFSRGCSELRVAKLSSQLRRICMCLNKNLDKVIKQDIETLLAKYHQRKDYSAATKEDYKRCLKQFYHWFEDDDPRLYNGILASREKARRFYKFVFSVKCNGQRRERNNEDILTDENIDQVIQDGTNSFKDKAFLKLLHETGMRCSEILTVKIKDLQQEGAVAKLTVPPMKTEQRTIPIIHSLPYTHKWLEIHPFKNDPEAFLFIGESRKHGKKPLTRDGAQRIVHRCFMKADLKKKNNLHWFRHSRATLLAPSLSEVLLCKYMGWVLGSKQVRTYVHLGEQELEDVYCDISGVKKVQEKKHTTKKKTCVCETLNDVGARYCYKCGQALEVSIILQDTSKQGGVKKKEFDAELEKSIHLLMKIAKNPELMKKFEEFKESINQNF